MYIYVHCESALKKSMLGIRQRRISYFFAKSFSFFRRYTILMESCENRVFFSSDSTLGTCLFNYDANKGFNFQGCQLII